MGPLPYEAAFMLDEIVSALGYTELCKSTYFGLHRQIVNRLKWFSEAEEHYKSLGIGSPRGFITERDYVLDCLARLDITNTIDHCDDLVSEFRKYVADRPMKKLSDDYHYQRPPGVKDNCTQMLLDMTYSKRKSLYTQRVMNAIRYYHSAGWYFVFNTLTISDCKLNDFYDSKSAIRDYFRSIGRSVLRAEGRAVSESYDDCFAYFCVPEYGDTTGRLHFHALIFMRTLPNDCVDPNLGLKVRNRREIMRLKGLWKFGFDAPIAVRYSSDAFSRLGWLWPVDKDLKPLKATDPSALGFYVSKYICKQNDLVKPSGGNKWLNYLKIRLASVPKGVFRMRMSRNFGLLMPGLDQLTTPTLLQMLRLDGRTVKYSLIMKLLIKRQLRSQLGGKCLREILELMPDPMRLLDVLRDLTRNNPNCNLRNFITLMTPSLTISDISKEAIIFLKDSDLLISYDGYKPSLRGGSK